MNNQADKYIQAHEACEQLQEALEQIFNGRVVVAWQVLEENQDPSLTNDDTLNISGGYKITETRDNIIDLKDCRLMMSLLSMLTNAFGRIEALGDTEKR
jgi:hypothetical protein